MGYRPYHDGAPALTAAQVNANYFEGGITVNTEAELTALLSPSVISGITYPAVPIGTFALRTDNDTLYVVNSSSAWEAFCDFAAIRALGRPNYDIYNSGGTLQGRVTMTTAGTATTFLVKNAAGTDIYRVKYDTAATGTKTTIQAVDASGIRISSLDEGFKIELTDTETLLQAVTGLKLKAATLLLEDAAGTGSPLLSLGGTSAGASKALGTDASGAITAYDRPTPYPSFMPTSIPGTAMAGDGIRLNAGRTAMEFGPVAGTGGGTANPAESFFTPSLPAAVRSAVAETQINIAAGTIDSSHPFSVTGNGIVVAAGTEAFFATLDYVLNINATAWTSGRSASGNRLFVEIYWKKDGTIITDTRVSHYIRGDEDWSSGDHYLHGIFSELLEPGTYTLWINRRVAAAAGNEITGYEIVAANSDIHIVTPGAGGSSGGASTFLGLTDTPSAYGTAGQIPIINAAATGFDFGNIPPPTIGPNTITAAQAQLDTTEHRQEWHHRLDIPAHDTVGIQDFTIFSGVPTSGGLVGFASTQAGTINGSTTSASFRVNDNLYSVTQVAQITTAGTNLNNIIIRIGPDPEANGDLNADWYFKVGGVFLSFANATKATVPGNRVTYTWTGSPRLFIGGQATICQMRQPLDDIHSGIPSNFSGLQGTVAPEQFRDDSIRYTRAIGGSLTDQAGWRTKAGFAALTNNAGQPLFYVRNQVIQQALDITSLNNFVPNAEPSAGVTPQLMKWGPGGLDVIQRLDLADLPRPPGLASGNILKWDGTAWIAAAETGGTTGAFNWATAGRMPNFNTLPGFTGGNRKVIIGTTTNNAYEFRQPQFSDLANQIAASQIGPSTINNGMIGNDQITPAKVNVGGNNLAAWQTRLGITTPTTGNAATWAQAGNTDLIPDSKLDPFVYHSFSKLETMVLTVGHFTGARGFDRITGGGGSLTNATFHLPGGAGNIQVIAIDQLPSTSVGGTAEITISLVGVLPLNFNQFYLVFERSGFAKVLRFEDATMRVEPTDTNYPAGLQNYTSYTWAAQPDNILYRQAANSTTNVFIAAPFDIAIEQYLLLPELPTTSGFKFLVGNNGGLRYRDVDLTATEQATFNIPAVSATRTNQTAQQVTLTGSGSTDFFTRSGSVLTARKNGLVIVNVGIEPGSGNEGLVEIYANVGNTQIPRSVRTIGRYREQDGWVFAYSFAAGDTLSLWYKPLDVPVAGQETNLPATPTFAVPTYSASDNKTTVAITAPSNTLYDYVEYSRRIHGAGTTDWEPWTRILGDSTSIKIPDVNEERTDVRVRLVNATGTGRYRQWVAGASGTTEEAVGGFGQTINFDGSVHISRPALNVA